VLRTWIAHYLGCMTPDELTGILDFLRASERLKTTHRSAYTSEGQQESVAEHTWRLCLMAMVLAPEFQGVDFPRLMKMCLVHDLGEAVGGDVPAPEQARRLAAGIATGKGKDERRDLLTLLQPLPSALQAEIAELWDDYEAAGTPEARLAKALDKLETIMQHTQGKNPHDFDYAFNLDYGREHTAGQGVIAEIRAILDADTARRSKEANSGAEL
jgi:putative hydrolase of HD superfamily